MLLFIKLYIIYYYLNKIIIEIRSIIKLSENGG